jgi:hypothetical protein
MDLGVFETSEVTFRIPNDNERNSTVGKRNGETAIKLKWNRSGGIFVLILLITWIM